MFEHIILKKSLKYVCFIKVSGCIFAPALKERSGWHSVKKTTFRNYFEIILKLACRFKKGLYICTR